MSSLCEPSLGGIEEGSLREMADSRLLSTPQISLKLLQSEQIQLQSEIQYLRSQKMELCDELENVSSDLQTKRIELDRLEEDFEKRQNVIQFELKKSQEKLSEMRSELLQFEETIQSKQDSEGLSKGHSFPVNDKIELQQELEMRYNAMIQDIDFLNNENDILKNQNKGLQKELKRVESNLEEKHVKTLSLKSFDLPVMGRFVETIDCTDVSDEFEQSITHEKSGNNAIELIYLDTSCAIIPTSRKMANSEFSDERELFESAISPDSIVKTFQAETRSSDGNACQKNFTYYEFNESDSEISIPKNDPMRGRESAVPADNRGDKNKIGATSKTAFSSKNVLDVHGTEVAENKIHPSCVTERSSLLLTQKSPLKEMNANSQSGTHLRRPNHLLGLVIDCSQSTAEASSRHESDQILHGEAENLVPNISINNSNEARNPISAAIHTKGEEFPDIIRKQSLNLLDSFHGSSVQGSSINGSSIGTELRLSPMQLNMIQSNNAVSPARSASVGRPPKYPQRQLANGCMVINVEDIEEKSMPKAECDCEARMLNGKTEHIEFYLPKTGMICTCGKNFGDKRFQGDGPLSLSNILREWQVDFLRSIGLASIEDFIKAATIEGGVLAKQMKRWRNARKMLPVRTKSCRVAIYIWCRTCKSSFKSSSSTHQKAVISDHPVKQHNTPESMNVSVHSGSGGSVSTLGFA